MQNLIHELHKKYSSLKGGAPASYIPELAHAHPEHFAIVVTTTQGEVFKAGDTSVAFSLQSTSKPLTYGLVLEEFGREFVLSKVGVEPTGEAFNSIVELEKNTHRPYNPMINSGAIAISSLIKGGSPDQRIQKVLEMFQKYTGREVSFDQKIFESEKNTAHRNRSIAHLLRHFDVIGDDIDESLDLYFKQCSVMVNAQDLSLLAATLANKGMNPITSVRAVGEKYVGDILSLMFTCGMYDSSGEWAYSVGIPAKSGVSGAIFGVVPGKMGIAVFSPPIDEKGHSIRGLGVFGDLSHHLGLSIFKQGH
jgi:glutaminase